MEFKKYKIRFETVTKANKSAASGYPVEIESHSEAAAIAEFRVTHPDTPEFEIRITHIEKGN